MFSRTNGYFLKINDLPAPSIVSKCSFFIVAVITLNAIMTLKSPSTFLNVISFSLCWFQQTNELKVMCALHKSSFHFIWSGLAVFFYSKK